MTYTVVIDPRASITGVGIGTDEAGTYATISPCCRRQLRYTSMRESSMICSGTSDGGGCRQVYRKFSGITSIRSNDGIWMQVFRWNEYPTDEQSLIELRDWIYRWTLLEVEISLTY